MVDLNLEFPNGWFDEEGRCGFNVDRQRKEIWAVELDLLAEIQRVCKKYNIQYFADGGTILGTIRHKGFIPWDDDIDIAMFRDQYVKFCSIAKDEFKSPYFFQTEETDPGSAKGHAQLRNSLTTAMWNPERTKKVHFNCGIFVDIFPIDAVADDEKDKIQQMNRIISLYKKYRFYRFLPFDKKESKFSWKRALIPAFNLRNHLLYNIFYDKSGNCKACHDAYIKFEHECQKYDDLNTELVSLLSFNPTLNRLIRLRSSYDSSFMMDFEFLQVPIPIGYEDILNRLYGDWHKMIRGFGNEHSCDVFDTCNSYTYYKM